MGPVSVPAVAAAEDLGMSLQLILCTYRYQWVKLWWNNSDWSACLVHAFSTGEAGLIGASSLLWCICQSYAAGIHVQEI